MNSSKNVDSNLEDPVQANPIAVTKLIPMKLFSTWEVEKSTSSCIPRLCCLNITKLVIKKSLQSKTQTVIISIKMQGSKRILRSNEMQVQLNGLFDAELDLSFTLQYGHYLKRDGANILNVMLEKRKKYKNRNMLGYKTLAIGCINMAQVLQQPLDMELDLFLCGKVGRSESVANLIILSLSSQPTYVDDKKNIQNKDRYSFEMSDEDVEEEMEMSSNDGMSDFETTFGEETINNRHDHHRNNRRKGSSILGNALAVQQQNLKQKFISLIRRFKVSDEVLKSTVKEISNHHHHHYCADKNVDYHCTEDCWDTCEEGYDESFSDSNPDMDLDDISLRSVPKPKLRPFFDSSKTISFAEKDQFFENPEPAVIPIKKIEKNYFESPFRKSYDKSSNIAHSSSGKKIEKYNDKDLKKDLSWIEKIVPSEKEIKKPVAEEKQINEKKYNKSLTNEKTHLNEETNKFSDQLIQNEKEIKFILGEKPIFIEKDNKQLSGLEKVGSNEKENKKYSEKEGKRFFGKEKDMKKFDKFISSTESRLSKKLEKKPNLFVDEKEKRNKGIFDIDQDNKNKFIEQFDLDNYNKKSEKIDLDYYNKKSEKLDSKKGDSFLKRFEKQDFLPKKFDKMESIFKKSEKIGNPNDKIKIKKHSSFEKENKKLVGLDLATEKNLITSSKDNTVPMENSFYYDVLQKKNMMKELCQKMFQENINIITNIECLLPGTIALFNSSDTISLLLNLQMEKSVNVICICTSSDEDIKNTITYIFNRIQKHCSQNTSALTIKLAITGTESYVHSVVSNYVKIASNRSPEFINYVKFLIIPIGKSVLCRNIGEQDKQYASLFCDSFWNENKQENINTDILTEMALRIEYYLNEASYHLSLPFSEVILTNKDKGTDVSNQIIVPFLGEVRLKPMEILSDSEESKHLYSSPIYSPSYNINGASDKDANENSSNQSNIKEDKTLIIISSKDNICSVIPNVYSISAPSFKKPEEIKQQHFFNDDFKINVTGDFKVNNMDSCDISKLNQPIAFNNILFNKENINFTNCDSKTINTQFGLEKNESSQYKTIQNKIVSLSSFPEVLNYSLISNHEQINSLNENFHALHKAKPLVSTSKASTDPINNDNLIKQVQNIPVRKDMSVEINEHSILTKFPVYDINKPLEYHNLCDEKEIELQVDYWLLNSVPLFNQASSKITDIGNIGSRSGKKEAVYHHQNNYPNYHHNSQVTKASIKTAFRSMLIYRSTYSINNKSAEQVESVSQIQAPMSSSLNNTSVQLLQTSPNLASLTVITVTKDKKQKIMRLGKKSKDVDMAKSKQIEGITRIICASRSQHHLLTVNIDGKDWSEIKFFQVSSQWLTQVKSLPILIFQKNSVLA